MPLTRKAINELTTEQLLDAIIEEAVELIYTTSKAKRYGLQHRHPLKPDADTNLMEICFENVQIGDLVRHLGARFGVNYANTCEMVRLKAEKQAEQGISFNKYESTKQGDK